MSDQRVLLNLGNLRTGGGLQVGASFLDEVAKLAVAGETRERWPWLLSGTVVEASHEVVANSTAGFDAIDVQIVDGSPLAAVRRGLGRHPPYDVTFTMFGPDYSHRRSERRVVGFADGTSLIPEYAAPGTGLASNAKRATRRLVSRTAFRQADRLVVESPHLVDELRTRWRISAPISLVPNVVNSVFHDQDAQENVSLPALASPTLLFPTRSYAHKNLPFLGQVGLELLRREGCRATFLLTLTEAEWEALPVETREFSVNLGPVRVSQLPSLYRASDAAFFPSLLESQSVTPLEALASGCPLLASDRPFVRSVVGEAAWYFDPLDPRSAADTVHHMMGDLHERERRRSLGLDLMAAWPSAADRAAAYLDIVNEELSAAGAPRAS